MVSTSPRLRCSSGSRLSEDEEDKSGVEAGEVLLGQEGSWMQAEGEALWEVVVARSAAGGAWPGEGVVRVWLEGVARGRACREGLLTAPAKVEDEAPLHVGAAHQILCRLDGVYGLGAYLAFFGAQSLALVAEYAGRASRHCEL